MRLTFEVDTVDRSVIFDLLGNATKPQEARVEVGPDVVVSYGEWQIRKAAGFPETLTLVAEIGSAVGVGLFTSWLYDKIRSGRAKTLRIEQTQIDIDEGEIKRVVTEKFEKHE